MSHVMSRFPDLVLIMFHVMRRCEAISDGEYRLTAPAFSECIVAGVEDLI